MHMIERSTRSLFLKGSANCARISSVTNGVIVAPGPKKRYAASGACVAGPDGFRRHRPVLAFDDVKAAALEQIYPF